MWNLFAGELKKRNSRKGQLAIEDDIRRVRAMENGFLDVIAQKALPELHDMMTDDVVLLTASGPLTGGRDALETLCRDLFDGFDIRHHVDFRVEKIEIENAAWAYLALWSRTRHSTAVVPSRYSACVGDTPARKWHMEARPP